MITTGQLRVRVNEELTLDAGTSEQVSGPAGPERLIRPPDTSLFHQVLAYLRAKPDPPRRPSGSMVGREGVAATALVLPHPSDAERRTVGEFLMLCSSQPLAGELTRWTSGRASP